VNIVIVIKSLGIVFSLIGLAYLLRPDVAKRLMRFFKKGNLSWPSSFLLGRVNVGPFGSSLLLGFSFCSAAC
jgi:hypothetical protein